MPQAAHTMDNEFAVRVSVAMPGQVLTVPANMSFMNLNIHHMLATKP